MGYRSWLNASSPGHKVMLLVRHVMWFFHFSRLLPIVVVFAMVGGRFAVGTLVVKLADGKCRSLAVGQFEWEWLRWDSSWAKSTIYRRSTGWAKKSGGSHRTNLKMLYYSLIFSHYNNLLKYFFYQMYSQYFNLLKNQWKDKVILIFPSKNEQKDSK